MCVVSYESCGIAGNDFYFNFTLFKEDGTTPEDLTGSTVIMQLLVEDCSPSITKAMNGGVVPGDEINGKVSFFLDATETQALLPLSPSEDCQKTIKYVADVQITWPDGSKEVLLRVSAKFDQGRKR